MLDFLFLAWFADVYRFYRKRVARKGLASVYYFLTIGGIWSVVVVLVSLLSFGKDLITGELSPSILLLAIPVGFLLGMVFAIVPWVMERKNPIEEDVA